MKTSFRGFITSSQLLGATSAACGLSFGLLGIIESQYYSPGSLAALMYGFGLYSVLGAFGGFLLALFFGGRYRIDHKAYLRFTCRLAIWPAAMFILAAGSYLVYRDAWNESLGSAGLTGWLLLLLVPVAALVWGFFANSFGHLVVSRPKGWAIGLVVIGLLGTAFASDFEKEWKIPDLKKEPDTTQSGPPVVFIVVDALRADVVDQKLTPNMYAFSKDAVVYRQAWSAASWTRPSVASIMTGRYPFRHRTIHKTDRLPSGLPTLADLLKKAGYVTLAAVTNVNLDPVFGLGRGFDTWAYFSDRPFLQAPPSARRLFIVEVYRLFRLKFFPGARDVKHYYAPGEKIVEQFQRFCSPLAKSQRQFFIYLHFMEHHDPYFAHPYSGEAVARVETPNPGLDRADELLNLYRQEVKHFDGLFAKLISYLKKGGLYDRALIVVTSDHGEEFADHGGFWHGTTLYQELVRVPLFIRFPNGVGAGSVFDEPVSLTDLMPTTLKVVNAQKQAGLDGQALSPTMAPSKRVIITEEDHQGCVLTAVRAGPYKLIRANADNPRKLEQLELYDLSVDHTESKNLVASETELGQELVRVMDSMANNTVDKSQDAAVKPEQVEIDSATQEQLRSLGYTE